MADGWGIGAALATAALVMTACDPGADATVSPRETPIGTGSITVMGDAPVMEATDLGDGHYGAILSAAYFEADGMRHAYVVGFGDDRGDQDVFHATSSDGIDWEFDENPPFAALGLELSPPGPIPGSVIQADDGTWVMYLSGVPAPQADGAEVYRATAPTPAGPWVADPEPVLPLGEPGAWDDLGLDFPGVVPMGGGYLMVYGGIDGSETTSIGVATSDDGIDWHKDPEPALMADACGKLGARYAAQPRPIPTAEGYLMLFDQNRETHLATSADGHAWTCAGPDPLLVAEDLPGGQGIHTIAGAGIDGEVSVLIESLIDRGGGRIGSEIWLGELQLSE